jgi:hypothetical protein
MSDVEDPAVVDPEASPVAYPPQQPATLETEGQGPQPEPRTDLSEEEMARLQREKEARQQEQP